MNELINPLQMAGLNPEYSPELINIINKDLPGFVDGSISDLVECEKRKKAALISANIAKATVNEAVAKAKEAKEVSSGLFKKGKAIEALKKVTESEARALDDISHAQIDQAEAIRVMFANQEKQAKISRNLCLLGMGNQAVANTVLKRLKESIEGGEMSNISEEVFQEFERIVMWWSQVEDMNAKISSYEQDVARIQTDYENLLKEITDIKTSLEKETDARISSIDNLQEGVTAVKNEVLKSISDLKTELRKEHEEKSEAIRQQIGEVKTANENGLLHHTKQFVHFREEYSKYTNQFVHKKIFKTIVFILATSAFVLSVISLFV